MNNDLVICLLREQNSLAHIYHLNTNKHTYINLLIQNNFPQLVFNFTININREKKKKKTLNKNKKIRT